MRLRGSLDSVMTPKGCWILAGLAMIAGCAIIAWWANYSMESPDMDAPFVVGWMAACTCVPLAVICFFIAAFVSGKPPEVEEKREQPKLASDFRWSALDDAERQLDETHDE